MKLTVLYWDKKLVVFFSKQTLMYDLRHFPNFRQKPGFFLRPKLLLKVYSYNNGTLKPPIL